MLLDCNNVKIIIRILLIVKLVVYAKHIEPWENIRLVVKVQ